MNRFTTLFGGDVTLGVEAHDIHEVVRKIRHELLQGSAKGNSVRVVFDLLERPGTVARVFPTPDTAIEVKSPKFHHATIRLVNRNRRELDLAHVWAESPMVPAKQFHANDHLRHITCKTCGNSLFYNVDRSLDYENHICSDCGSPAHTLTETGASS